MIPCLNFDHYRGFDMLDRWELEAIRNEKKAHEAREANPELQLLTQFLCAVDNREIYRLTLQVEPHFIGEFPLFEKKSILEIAAERGLLNHVRVLLCFKSEIATSHTPSSFSRVESFLFELNEVGAFFRALENGHIAVAQHLLSHLAKFLDFDNAIINERLISENIYLSRVARTECYPALLYNGIKLTGNRILNAAFIRAASANDAVIFNMLVQNKSLKEQSARLCIAAFLSATRDAKGKAKPDEDYNRDIVFQLLEIDAVKRFAQSRPYDFNSICFDFDRRFNAISPQPGAGFFSRSISGAEMSDLDAHTDESSSRGPSRMNDDGRGCDLSPWSS